MPPQSLRFQMRALMPQRHCPRQTGWQPMLRTAVPLRRPGTIVLLQKLAMIGMPQKLGCWGFQRLPASGPH